MRLLAYDFTLGKPGCALIQAAMGSDYNQDFELDFPSDTWLITPTANMRVYELNDDQYLYLTLISELVSNGMTVQEAKAELTRQAREAP
jgi:hypothetical protein